MLSAEKGTVQKAGGIVHPVHPAIIGTVVLADKTKMFSEGTIVKLAADGKSVEAAAAGDIPIAVLAEGSGGVNAEVLAVLHGAVVRSRLVDASGSSETAAADGFVAKLRATGIFAVQLFDSAKVV